MSPSRRPLSQAESWPRETKFSGRAPVNISEELVEEAARALSRPGVHVHALDAGESAGPGLYAAHGSPAVWIKLGLGEPPDARPLYVGKAEHSLYSRDVLGHFGQRERTDNSPTGGSTLRRGLAALLAPARGYVGMPRNPTKPGYFANYGLSIEHDDDLSKWMLANVTLSLWPHRPATELDRVETRVLLALKPPLNSSKVKTPGRTQVRDARKVLTAQARAWRP
jgi:hypothetical protein